MPIIGVIIGVIVVRNPAHEIRQYTNSRKISYIYLSIVNKIITCIAHCWLILVNALTNVTLL